MAQRIEEKGGGDLGKFERVPVLIQNKAKGNANIRKPSGPGFPAPPSGEKRRVQWYLLAASFSASSSFFLVLTSIVLRRVLMGKVRSHG